jgi:hypothetical protein
VKIIRKKLSQADLLPPGVRYDEPTDTIQTWDGTSWIDTPERDPRNNDSFPPPDTVNPRCDGAARMSAFLQETVDGIIDGVDAGKSDAEVALVVLGVLVFIPFIDLLYILIASLVGALIIVGSAWLHDAFDTFVWSDLTCVIYARLNEDGFITDEQLASLRTAISDEFAIDPASVLLDILVIVGRGGLNDAAALRSETGNCSACQVLGWEWDFSDSANGWYAESDRGLYVPGWWTVSTRWVGYLENEMRLAFAFPTTFEWARVEVEVMHNYTRDLDEYIKCPGYVFIQGESPPALNVWNTLVYPGPHQSCGLVFRILWGSVLYWVRVRKIRIFWTSPVADDALSSGVPLYYG